MRKTLKLPNDLLRRIKIRAVVRNQKLKNTVAELLELGLANEPKPIVSVYVPKPVHLKHKKLLTFRDIEAAITADRE